MRVKIWLAAWVIGAGGASAQNLDYVQNYVDMCVSRSAPKRAVITACTLAVQSGRLTPTQEAQALINRGVANFDQEKYTLALRDYDLAARRDANLYEIHLNRGNVLRRLQRPVEALSAYNRALVIERDDIPALMGRGAALLSLASDKAAEADFSRVLRQRPGDEAALFNRGLARLGMGEADGAIEDFTRVLEVAPGDARAYFNRGQSQELRGDLHQAYLDYGRAIERDPAYAAAYFRRGRLLAEDGRHETATPDLMRAYEMGYDDPWLAQYVIEAGR